MGDYEEYLFFVENEPEPLIDVLFALGEDSYSYNKLLEFGYTKFYNGSISFSFVGLIVLPKFNVCILPKYFKGIHLSKEQLLYEFIKVIKVLRKAGKIETSLPDFHLLNNNTGINLSEIVIADHILRDYLDHGIYRQVIGLNTVNGMGEINWGMTVDLLDPVISKGTPIYFDSYSSLQSINEFNVISEIHKFAVGTSLKKFGLLLDYQFSYEEDFKTELLDIGTIEYLTTLLNRELNSIYGDRQIALIKRLLLYIKSLDSIHNTESLNIFGTGYFHTIWEKACGVLFKNKLDKYKQYVSIPQWSDLNGNSVFKEGLRPDIISEGKDHETLAILDAKYYNLSYRLNPFHVSGNPGISDVTKQFLYQKIIEKNTNYNVSNFFLFPSFQEEGATVIGFTTLPLFPDEKIFNVKLSVDIAMEAYLVSSSSNEDILESLMKKIA